MTNQEYRAMLKNSASWTNDYINGRIEREDFFHWFEANARQLLGQNRAVEIRKVVLRMRIADLHKKPVLPLP
jgi:hypothetical protein